MIAHWDEAESGRAEAGHLGGVWTALGRAAGTKTVGLNRIQVDPGKWSTPFHRQTAEEEIFFVLGGSGVCLLQEAAFEVRSGDCIVHRAGEAHALRAGDDGLDVLAFGTRGRAEVGHLARAGVGWIGGIWTDVGTGDHPCEREAAAGEPELPEVGARGAAGPRRPRALALRLVGDRARLPRGGARHGLPGLRHPQRERRLLLPALEQDRLPRARSGRSPGRHPLRRRRTGQTDG
ncbi:MAG: cupin domain-containing protein [Gaiellaceae bacterium]